MLIVKEKNQLLKGTWHIHKGIWSLLVAKNSYDRRINTDMHLKAR